MNKARKNIVFDWNCTLLDDFQPMYDCTNLILVQAGYPPVAIDHFRHHYNIPFEKFYKGMGFCQADIDRLMRLENNAFHDHYESLADKAALRGGADDILRQARQYGVRSFILSNHVEGPIRAQLRRFEIEHLLDDVLAYADRASQFRDMSKGQRLKHFMKEQAMIPKDTMIVGDSVEEIEIAHEQGLISVAITGGCVSEERLRAGKPDYVIHSLHQLQPILQERAFVL